MRTILPPVISVHFLVNFVHSPGYTSSLMGILSQRKGVYARDKFSEQKSIIMSMIDY